MIIVIIISLLIAGGGLFIKQPQFGKEAEGERLEKIKRSPNYKEGKFQNRMETPQIAEGASYFKVFGEFFFNKSKRSVPDFILPSKKLDLSSLNIDENIFIWLGHSSYFIQIDRKRVLVDPVLCGNASPVSFITKSFEGTDPYTPEDFPEIDYLLITHDHYDHLDYETLQRMKSKIKKIITGLGVGAHIQSWGYDKEIITELDWDNSYELEKDFEITATTARHFSGRSLNRNSTLWLSFVLKTPNYKFFMSGDGGYGPHFKEIGDKHGPFDLAFIECGQYNQYWKYIHLFPEETVQAALDLKARKFVPIHWGKFSLSLHSWDEPIIRVVEESKRREVPLFTPLIGAKTGIKDSSETEYWWRAAKR